jgi:hypothetical protein
MWDLWSTQWQRSRLFSEFFVIALSAIIIRLVLHVDPLETAVQDAEVLSTARMRKYYEDGIGVNE